MRHATPVKLVDCGWLHLWLHALLWALLTTQSSKRNQSDYSAQVGNKPLYKTMGSGKMLRIFQAASAGPEIQSIGHTFRGLRHGLEK